jgi:hypothetical protein
LVQRELEKEVQKLRWFVKLFFFSWLVNLRCTAVKIKTSLRRFAKKDWQNGLDFDPRYACVFSPRKENY